MDGCRNSWTGAGANDFNIHKLTQEVWSLSYKISDHVTNYVSWRWPFWELLWLGIAVFLVMLAALPETSAAKILHNRMKRLRPIGEANETTHETHRINWTKLGSTVKETLYTPLKIMIQHPGILFSNVYTCIIYGLYYTFFNSFPLVYLDIYNFSYEDLGLSFLAVTVGTFVGTFALLPWAVSWARSAKTTSPYSCPERVLVPGLFATFAIPIGLLIFGEQ